MIFRSAANVTRAHILVSRMQPPSAAFDGHRVHHAMTSLQALHAHLIREVFARALAGDAELADSVGRFDGIVRLEDKDLLFTLPDLFRFLLSDFERAGHGTLDVAARDYKPFHRMLYRSRTNAQLRSFGALVVVEHADDDHALSLYRLTRCRD